MIFSRFNEKQQVTFTKYEDTLFNRWYMVKMKHLITTLM